MQDKFLPRNTDLKKNTDSVVKIHFNNVALFRGEKLLYRQLSFDIYIHKLTQIKAPNGYGKSSLLKAIISPSLCDDGAIKHTFSHSDIIYLNEFLQFRSYLSLNDNLKWLFGMLGTDFSLNIQVRTKKTYDEFIERVLTPLNLMSFLDVPVYELSQGQRKKLSLLWLWLDTEYDLSGQKQTKRDNLCYLVDEPFNGLDQDSVKFVLEHLFALANFGHTVILVSHLDITPICSKNTSLIDMYDLTELSVSSNLT